MILLDTNVISEPLKPRPEPFVIEWLNAQEEDELYLPSIVVAERYYGWFSLPEGRRKDNRGDGIVRTIEQFEGRIIDFDFDAACEYGRIMAVGRSAGIGIPVIDGQIAAIARAHGASLATRNVKDFEHTGITVLNPWAARQ